MKLKCLYQVVGLPSSTGDGGESLQDQRDQHQQALPTRQPGHHQGERLPAVLSCFLLLLGLQCSPALYTFLVCSTLLLFSPSWFSVLYCSLLLLGLKTLLLFTPSLSNDFTAPYSFFVERLYCSLLLLGLKTLLLFTPSLV